MGRKVLPWLVVFTAVLVISAPAAQAASCPTRVSPSAFASASELRALNTQMWKFGVRPTGSANQTRFIDWIEKELREIDGVQLKSLPYKIRRWDASRTTLSATIGGQRVDLPVAGSVPYSEPTGSGAVSGPVALIGEDEDITAANAGGKIVIKRLAAGSVPLSVFNPGALGYALLDPTKSLDMTASWKRTFLAGVVPDLQAAGKAGAKAILFSKELPRDQIRGFYAPYEGVQWDVPAAYLGVDEGERIISALEAGQSVDASFDLQAKRTGVTTRTILATLPGRSAEKLVVDSHTDGVNAVWDNGPIAMLAMARYLASLPKGCRLRTTQFAFVTGHIYQRIVSRNVRHGGSGQVAAMLDKEYDQGKVAGVMVLEHFGAKEYETFPRGGGKPGSVLKATGQPELLLTPVSDSLALRKTVTDTLRRAGLPRTAVITGADAPDASRSPRHCSFGGEGTPYNEHILPVVSPIAAPNYLFFPAFGMETIDVGLMRTQSIGFTDVFLAMSRMSRSAIAGDVTALRKERASGKPGCPVENG